MFRISEPTTTLTDYILGAACIYFAFLSESTAWSITFLCISSTAVLGGTYHGFQKYLSKKTAETLWLLTGISASLSSSFLLIATALSLTSGILLLGLILFSLLKWLTALRILQKSADFKTIIIDHSLSLGILAGAYSLLGENTQATLVTLGALIGLMGNAVQYFRISIHKQFNHNDLYHVIQTIALFYISKGV